MTNSIANGHFGMPCDVGEKAFGGATTQAPRIAVVMPAYNVAGEVVEVLRRVPSFVSKIVVVDDGSLDGTAERVTKYAEQDARIVLVRHEKNRGVSAAMVTGFAAALVAKELNANCGNVRGDVSPKLGPDFVCRSSHSLDPVDHIIVKMDADGQMNPEDLPGVLEPLLAGRADYAKGNRFRDFDALRQMPWRRMIGNTLLSFMAKVVTGYWNLFDPTNGFLAIRADVLRQVRLSNLQGYYIFETAMLAELYLLGAVVEDVPMKAYYGNERSHLSIGRAMLIYPWRLLWMFVRRILLRYYVSDFTMASVFLLIGCPMVLIGAVYGAINWWHYSHLGVSAPTGTVVLPAMFIILGVQFLLSAINEDLRNVPTHSTRPPNTSRFSTNGMELASGDWDDAKPMEV